MRIAVIDSKTELGVEAARRAAELLVQSIQKNAVGRFIAATGVSQFEFLAALRNHTEIAWNRTEMFHLDEYLGISATHPASFRRYLQERIVNEVHPRKVWFIQGDTNDPPAECQRLEKLIRTHPIDVAFVGIGENGHLAFNDPPADFTTKRSYIIVQLDAQCRAQQLGEGWFSGLDEVPTHAISMSVFQILQARTILCICPDLRKAHAVKACLAKSSPISPMNPASILRTHSNVEIFLDTASASLLSSEDLRERSQESYLY